MGKRKPVARINVLVNGVTRNLIRLDSHKDGSVYVRNKAGESMGTGANELKVKETRFSVHFTPDNPDYNLVKHTVTFATPKGDYIIDSPAYTDAVKQRNGHSLIFTHRTSKLKSSIHDVLHIEPVDETIDLEPFDPNREALFYGLFVGHPETQFPEQDGVRVKAFQYHGFGFALCYAYKPTEASDIAWTQVRITDDPRIFPDEAARFAAATKLHGETPDQCAHFFELSANEMHVNLLQAIRREQPERAAELDALIDTIPRMATIHMGPDPRQVLRPKPAPPGPVASD